MKRGAYLLCTLLVLPALAVADVTVTVGDPAADPAVPVLIPLLPNTPGQEVPVYIRSEGTTELIETAVVVAMLWEGTIADLPPDGTTPYIEGINLYTTGIFNGNNTGPGGDADGGPGKDADQVDAFENRGVLSGGNPQGVPADGLLGVIIIDTTGFESGEWPLRLSNPDPLLDTTAFSSPGATSPDINANLGKGTLTIIPEPASLALLALGALGLLRRRR